MSHFAKDYANAQHCTSSNVACDVACDVLRLRTPQPRGGDTLDFLRGWEGDVGDLDVASRDLA